MTHPVTLVNSARVEAFSDAVIAVAATILVLQLKVPDSGEDLIAYLATQIPTLAAYFVSFLTILIFWVNHHSFFAAVAHVSRAMLFVNGAFLLAITFISYTTAAVGHALQTGTSERAAAVLYAVSLAITASSFTALRVVGLRNPELLVPDAQQHVGFALRRSLAGPLAYTVAAGVALVSASASLAVDAAVAAFFALMSGRKSL